MNKPDDGGPAFASVAAGPAGDIYHQPGMALRDWFAGQALVGLVERKFGTGYGPVDCARMAYLIADAMLAARQKDGAS